jgi:hypothetical protein
MKSGKNNAQVLISVQVADPTEEPRPRRSIASLMTESRGVNTMAREREVLTPTEARQASPRRLNFRVLVTSLLLALVAAAIVYTFFYSNTPDPVGEPANQSALPAATLAA